jgi:2-C-methyl-D-erythritol 2,4-cyclodiphosphate synthase
MNIRTGIGYDTHQLAEGRPLILGGVTFESPVGLKGHSDADVLLHAIIDALLGAAGMGDIGTLFPDTSDKWKGADSAKLTQAVVVKIKEAGFQIGNVDATVIAEAPKLNPRIGEVRDSIAGLLEIERDCVSVKATTNEKMGAIGRKEGIAVLATCLISMG